MSQVKIQGNASGTGIFTVAAPNSNTDRTLTLPDTSGTIGLSGAAVTRSQMPTGSVIQVVQTVKTDTFSSTGTSFVDITGMSVAITPTSSSNKILVLFTISCSGGNNSYAAIKLLRDSTDIVKGDTGSPGIECTFGMTNAGTGGDWGYGSHPYSFTYLDSPATTSSTTYKVQVSPMRTAGGYTFWLNRSEQLGDDNQFRTASTITVMEIAA